MLNYFRFGYFGLNKLFEETAGIVPRRYIRNRNKYIHIDKKEN